MTKRLVLILIIVAVCLASSASAEQDSLWVGELNGYYVGNTVFKVPVYFSNNISIQSLSFQFLYVSSGNPIMPDSVTLAGRTTGMDIFQLFRDFSGGDGYGANPDSTCVGLISFHGEIPPGDGIIVDLWFSGGQIGDLISFVPIDFYPPSCYTNAHPENPDGIVQVVTNIIIVPGGTEIVCPSNVSGQATHAVSFPIDVIGTDSPFELEILSFDGPAHNNEPSLSGTNPWSFNWVPGFSDIGEYTLVLSATDADEVTVNKTVTITVSELEVDPCDVARGDLNCDGKIDIADLVFMVDWMFMDGPAPYCK